MITTGTFLELMVKTVDKGLVPVILGKTRRGYFICLLEHDAAFELEYAEEVDKDNFTCYMDGTSAELVAVTVKQAIKLLFYCGGDPNCL